MTASTTSGAAGGADAHTPIKVMVVDDSAIVRGLLTRVLEAEDDIKVVASAGDGLMALNAIERHDIDVVVLDIEMPRMDGLTALPKLIEARPGVKIVMASTLTLRNAEISIRALELGAHDYVTKPSSRSGLHSAEDFQRELVSKVRALGQRRRPGRVLGARPVAPENRVGPVETAAEREPKITLRPAPTRRPKVIAIGSSTGGPQALQTVLRSLPPGVQQPILITQHMPATFTKILAQHIAQATGRPCAEGRDGEPVQSGRIYVAPGEYHMQVETTSSGARIRLNQDPPENFCRPAVDVMLRSVAEVYGAATLVVILTGMGSDGLKGSEKVVAAGGAVIAQDEPTSVVWGMPGAVAQGGLCSAVLPLDRIGKYIGDLATRAAA